MPNTTDSFAVPPFADAPSVESSTHHATLRRAALHAAAIASAANAAFYLATSQFGFFPQWVLIPGANAPITLTRVIVATALCVAAAVGVYGWMRRRFRDPARTFRWTALVILLLSFTQPPLVLQDAPLRMLLALDVLHVIAAAVVLKVLRVGAGGTDVRR